jgi:predicted AlkP superfamily pyrophosphatase or phosphodiesterase
MKRNLFLTSAFVLIMAVSLLNTGCTPQAKAGSNEEPKIKLVLTIVVDQFRADMIPRFQHRLGKGGFNYLIHNGAWYKETRYHYSNTITAVGHATIYTGGAPADHGIVGNYWLDKHTGKIIRCASGPSPSQPGEQVAGPYRLTGTTIGDELILASGNKSRVFSVSVKDRGAILPGGFLGKAFWYSSSTGQFITSDYYYPQNKQPQWLGNWNKRKPADSYKNRNWTLKDKNKNNYVYGDSDDREEEKTYNIPVGRTTTFPHSLKTFQGAKYYSQLRYTPFVDRLTLEFAEHLVKAEKIAQKGHIDLLAVSFSATDYIGHAYGPNSLEYEDNLLHLDETLARLFKFIDQTVGLDHTLIVLTSDHGVDLIPEYRKRLGMPAARVDAALFKKVIDSTLQKKYNTTESFTYGYRCPSIYLNLKTIEKLGLNIEEVETEAAKAVLTIDGIDAAVTRTDLLKNRVPDSRLIDGLKAVFHPKRSGNILVLQKPLHFLDYILGGDSATHNTHYTYDSHVPLFFCGKTIKPQTIYRPVTPLDIAPTLSHLLNTATPSASSGIPLHEILK